MSSPKGQLSSMLRKLRPLPCRVRMARLGGTVNGATEPATTSGTSTVGGGAAESVTADANSISTPRALQATTATARALTSITNNTVLPVADNNRHNIRTNLLTATPYAERSLIRHEVRVIHISECHSSDAIKMGNVGRESVDDAMDTSDEDEESDGEESNDSPDADEMTMDWKPSSQESDDEDRDRIAAVTALLLLGMHPRLHQYRSILPPHIFRRTDPVKASICGVDKTVLHLIRNRRLEDGNGVTSLDVVKVRIASQGEEERGKGPAKNKLWVLKRYDPARKGSGYGFSQQKLQGMLQIEAERRAYSRISAARSSNEGSKFLMWMGASVTLDNGNLGILMMMTDLDDWLKAVGVPAPEETRRIIAQCIVGVATLHSIGVIHADIKPANIFLDARRNVKIGDFGLSRFSNEPRPLHATVAYGGDRVGTEGYMAPEVCARPPQYSYQIDFWSLGVVFWQMLMGDPDKFLKNLSKPGRWAKKYKTSKERRSYFVQQTRSVNKHELTILCGLLDPCPQTRMGVEELLLQKYFENDGGGSVFERLHQNGQNRPFEVPEKQPDEEPVHYLSCPSNNEELWGWIGPDLFDF